MQRRIKIENYNRGNTRGKTEAESNRKFLKNLANQAYVKNVSRVN